MDRVTRKAGFTLVEIMLAMVLLAIGVLAMIALQAQAMRGSQLGRHYTDAAQIAGDRMEELMGLPWDDMAPTGWTGPIERRTEVQIDGEAASVEQVYQVSHRIVADNVADPDGTIDVRTVDVRVIWFEANDDPGEPPRRRYAMTSSRFNDGK